MKFFLKAGLLSTLVVLFFFSIHHTQAATACSSNSVFNAKPFWGNNSTQTVSADKGSQVTITFEGEDGCAGNVARFPIYAVNDPNGGSVEVVSATLNLGSAVPNKQGMFFLSVNWKIDIGPGTYSVGLQKVGNNLFGGVGLSPNQLIVKAKQDCNISKVYVSPNGGKPGESVQLIVESQGSCQGWKASLNVVNTDPGTPASRLTPFKGAPQDISSLKAVWSWTFPAVSEGRQWDNYELSANLGNQNDVRSGGICVGSCGSQGGQRYVCSDYQCVLYQGQSGTVYSTSNCDNKCGAPGSTQTYPFEITNPLKGGVTDFTSLIKIIAQWIFNLAIPIAVAMIVYSGILFLTAAGEPAKVTKAKEVLKYAVIGLAIILIGSGFVTLIQSILKLGGTGTTQDQNQNPGLPVGPQQQTSAGAVGNTCSKDSNCFTGLKCKNTICQRVTGNNIGEPCNGGASCDIGLACDATGGNVQVIDGQTLGSCFETSATGGRIGDICQKDNDCISGLKCNQICQRKDGNLNDEACLKTSNPSNCKSKACSTIGATTEGVCVQYSGT